ncbi:MAG TPA: adenylate/guanylate cyclase domain-containing protein [Labilithrix sp.]
MSDKSKPVRLAVALIAGAMHVVQGVVMLAFGHPALGLLSFAAVIVFVGVVWLVVRGRSRLGAWIAYTEILLHVTFMVWVWGSSAGFWTYYVPLAGGGFLAFTPEEKWDRYAATALPFVVAPLAFFWSRGRGPAIDLSPSLVSLFSILNVFGALFGSAAIVGWFATVAHRAEQASEKLLLNILPAPIAARLKEGETTIADAFPAVTVLFADIVGFTSLSARISTAELILVLNEIFSAFDALADEYGLEKIKTIGDAYMVVGGVPTARADHADAVASMALAMRDVVAKRTDELRVRIGVHSGPVVAGVIGTRKFTYDLWGDTVNTASRMESHGEPGRIQVSEATRDLLADRFELEARGAIAVKGKGEMRTFFLERRIG